MIGHPGPYANDDGDVWVPRTVPYLEARRIAKEAITEYGDRLRYVGKRDGYLYGFTRDCYCDSYCALRDPESVDSESGDDEDTCLVPSWAFRIEESR